MRLGSVWCRESRLGSALGLLSSFIRHTKKNPSTAEVNIYALRGGSFRHRSTIRKLLYYYSAEKLFYFYSADNN